MKLPIPQRGQPFDVSLISNIITSVNELWDNLVVNVSNYASLYTSEGRKNVRSTEVKIVTGMFDTGQFTAKAGEAKPFSYSFDMPFALPPIVTATAQTATSASKNGYAVITSITESRVEGIIVFSEKGASQVIVNIIAIGQAA